MRNLTCHSRLVIYAFAVAACGSIGCQDSLEERVPVAGKVLLDGQPLSGGTIRFVPKSGRPASSAIMPDGSFELAAESVNRVSAIGVPPGRYRVQVSASKIVDDETIRWIAPAKYADFRTSGLDVTIEKPTEDLLIELSWDGEKPAEDWQQPAHVSKPSEGEQKPVSEDAPSSAVEGESI